MTSFYSRIRERHSILTNVNFEFVGMWENVEGTVTYGFRENKAPRIFNLNVSKLQ
jgi:hypothetical protein